MVAKAAASEDRKRPREEEPQDEGEEPSTEGMRSGKWTKEEEVYADALIQRFESGTLSDCDNGKTLRAYLSKKLNCIPMRVSKKYGGKCIGKHTYKHVSESNTANEAAELEELAQICWTSIERRLKNKQKRVHRREASSSDSNSDTMESLPCSDKTDQEDMFLDDLLMYDFFPDSLECGSDPVDESIADCLLDWSADDCLLLM